jgi:hypothetical protein
MSQASDTAQATGDRLAATAQAVPQMASNLLQSVSGNPVLLGAFGLAIGALLGAIVPQSEQEAAALKNVADDAREAVKTMAVAGGFLYLGWGTLGKAFARPPSRQQADARPEDLEAAVPEPEPA